MAWGVPFAEFSILPNLFVADSAARTAQNLAAHQGLFVVAISGRYVGVNLEFLFVTSFGELVLLVWLIGWGTRLRD